MAFLERFGRAPELGDSVAEVRDEADVLADALRTGSTGSTSPAATGGGSGVEMEVLVVGPPLRGRPRIFFPSAGRGELVVESLSVAFASCNCSASSSF